MIKIKKYSLTVHALHSRLQLIKNKLDFAPGMLPGDVAIRNKKYFDKASESVLNDHELRCDRSDYYHAAELFLISLDEMEKEILNLPLWKREEDKNNLEL